MKLDVYIKIYTDLGMAILEISELKIILETKTIDPFFFFSFFFSLVQTMGFTHESTMDVMSPSSWNVFYLAASSLPNVLENDDLLLILGNFKNTLLFAVLGNFTTNKIYHR